MSKTYSIYRITTPFGFYYVGKTRKFHSRMKQHLYYRPLLAIKNAIELHGRDGIKVEILVDDCPEPWASYYENKYAFENKELSINRQGIPYLYKKSDLDKFTDPFYKGYPWNKKQIIFNKRITHV